jgi:LDH2 family malate/lactate/ureidoglycolate dehydrogenase
MTTEARTARFSDAELARFCIAALAAAGANQPTAEAATQAMLHASRLGIDSHGVRLLPHYVRVIEGGRVNGRPRLSFVRLFGATSLLDADNGHGGLATFTAMERAAELAHIHGLGAVAIRRSSHFGAAGAYALKAAEAGLIGLATCNSDSGVRLFEGAQPFHGTNPIAVAVPIQGQRPWLLDMATSAIPFNRVHLFASLGRTLPAGVASDAEGRDTTEPEQVKMLAPLGGAFGFKGAGLAGVAEILSAALTGMGLGFELLPMGGPDFSTPRELGAFVLALDPSAFAEAEAFDATMRRYVDAIRRSRAVPGGKPLAPGDREWAEADRRQVAGIPVDVKTVSAFEELAERFGFRPPERLPA